MAFDWKIIPVITLAAVALTAPSAALGEDELPPSWKAGGQAKKDFYYRRKSKQGKPIIDEADFEPEPEDERRKKIRRHVIGVWGATPELMRLEYRYSTSSKLAFFLGLSGPMPIDVNVSMPSDVITSDRSKTLAVAYPAFDIKFKVTWGPHVYTGLAWHPLGGAWYTTWAAGFRSVGIKGETAAPLRVCSINEARKEPPCGNDAAAIQTRNKIALNADVSIQSFAGRLATGWIYSFSPKVAFMAELGIFAPITSRENTDITASILAPDGTPEELSGALSDLRSKSQTDLADKAEAELGKVINKPLPVAGIGLGYRF
jgi:hypothetical protein